MKQHPVVKKAVEQLAHFCGRAAKGMRKAQAKMPLATQWMGQKVRDLRTALPRLREPRTMAFVGSGAAIVFTLVLMAVPGGAERTVRKAALSGRELFSALAAQHKGIATASQVDEGATRDSSTNRVVLSETAWETLTIEQRNSIGSWLNQLGGFWEIRVGRASRDDQRVLDSEPVITSKEWNRQLR